MKFTGKIVRYSPAEDEILKMLDTKPISSIDLMKRRYGRRVPINGRVIIVGIIRSLMTKTRKNKETHIVCKSGRTGPNPMTVWMEKAE